ncbi:hypothetical protein BE21_06795 [Sorangium cellulosum]|uniref:Uncharacterized protein n=1 Tax=Sorangium cellulosum TaxID=56 RepID=A0A150T838_SORCE|nr:hypothetical protein BE21_06795 [Sorangium cellulosum]
MDARLTASAAGWRPSRPDHAAGLQPRTSLRQSPTVLEEQTSPAPQSASDRHSVQLRSPSPSSQQPRQEQSTGGGPGSGEHWMFKRMFRMATQYSPFAQSSGPSMESPLESGTYTGL